MAKDEQDLQKNNLFTYGLFHNTVSLGRLLLKRECLFSVIKEKVLVHISDVSHIKPLSKDFKVQLGYTV
jgi:hypothetical protein